MSVVNRITDTTTTHSISGGSDPANGYDEDFDTFHGDEQSRGGSGDFGLTSNLSGTHTFVVARTLTIIKYKVYSTNTANGSYPNGSGSYSVDIQQSGSWTTLWSGSCGLNGTIDTGVVTQTGTWADVTAIRVTVAATSGGDRSGYLYTKLFDVQAFSVVYSPYAGVI